MTQHNRLLAPQAWRDFLPYRLIQLVGVAGAPVTRWCEGRFGISRRQWRLVSALAEDGDLLSSELAQRMELDRVRTSRALGELEAKGLIIRSHPPGNARQVRVSLTPQGRATFDALRPLVLAHHQRLLEAFTPAQVCLFDEMLSQALIQAERINRAYTDLPKAERRLGVRSRRGSSVR